MRGFSVLNSINNDICSSINGKQTSSINKKYSCFSSIHIFNSPIPIGTFSYISASYGINKFAYKRSTIGDIYL